MGAGLARQARERYRDIAVRYGRALSNGHCYLSLPAYRLVLGPTKDDWCQPATVSLVEKTIDKVAEWCAAHRGEAIAVPALGCGLGGIDYATMRGKIVSKLSSFRAVLVPPPPSCR